MTRLILVFLAGSCLAACANAPKPPSCSTEALRPLSSTPATLAKQLSAREIADSYACGGA